MIAVTISLWGECMRIGIVGLAVFVMVGVAGTARANCTSDMRARFAVAERNTAMPMPTKKDADQYGTKCFQDPEPRHPLPTADIDKLLGQVLPAKSPLITNAQQDVAQICPHYFQMPEATQAAVWRGIFKAMIGAESSGYRDARFWENGDPQSLRGEYSVGLIQLSISNASPYGCDLPNEMALKDPARNLACAVRIMTKLTTPRERVIVWTPKPPKVDPQAKNPNSRKPVKIPSWRYVVKDPGGIGGPNPIGLEIVDYVKGRPPLPFQWSGAARYWKTLQGRRLRVIQWMAANVPQCGLPVPSTSRH
jgi:hypothetical protein